MPNLASALQYYLLDTLQKLEVAKYQTDRELEIILQEEAYLRQRKALAEAKKRLIQAQLEQLKTQ